MSYCILDVETNTFQKGNPFSQQGKLVAVGIQTEETVIATKCLEQYKGTIQEYIYESDLIIGFNIKFDLHWICNYGININNIKVWDCQLAEFMLEGQTNPYPSLDKACAKYGLPLKLDVVKNEYWAKGIDTDAVPEEILLEYLEGDLDRTERVYHKQVEQFKLKPQLYKLFRLHCEDLLVLQEMEYNGMAFNVEEAAILEQEEQRKINEVLTTLKEDYEDIPINFSSRDHLSCYLYGGVITIEDRLPIGVYKTGAKVGHTRFKKIEYEFKLPQLVPPPKNSELKKEGYYATDEETLRSIKSSKKNSKRLEGILQLAESNKLIGTYYRGIPKLIQTMDWPSGRIHGQFNQCVTATGRLSSSRPNLQNFAGIADKLLVSEL